jgi:hypothetical protein
MPIIASLSSITNYSTACTVSYSCGRAAPHPDPHSPPGALASPSSPACCPGCRPLQGRASRTGLRRSLGLLTFSEILAALSLSPPGEGATALHRPVSAFRVKFQSSRRKSLASGKWAGCVTLASRPWALCKSRTCSLLLTRRKGAGHNGHVVNAAATPGQSGGTRLALRGELSARLCWAASTALPSASISYVPVITYLVTVFHDERHSRVCSLPWTPRTRSSSPAAISFAFSGSTSRPCNASTEQLLGSVRRRHHASKYQLSLVVERSTAAQARALASCRSGG